jgi:hypothetical protein
VFFTNKDLLFKELHFVTAAVCFDQPQGYQMSGVCIEAPADDADGSVRLVATDGRRLHLATVPKEMMDKAWPTWTPGLYQVVRQRSLVAVGKPIKADFPPYRRAIRDAEPRGLLVDLDDTALKRSMQLHAFEIAFYSRLKGFIQPKYLQDLVGYLWMASMTTANAAVRFDCLDHPLTAFIMPLFSDQEGVFSFKEVDQPGHCRKLLVGPTPGAAAAGGGGAS